MKKSLFLSTILFGILSILSGCSKVDTHQFSAEKISTNSVVDTKDSKVKLNKAEYKNNEIMIAYPQISNDFVKNKDDINKLVKDYALDYVNECSLEVDAEDPIIIDMDYTCEIIGNKILSICFKGYRDSRGLPHPTSLFSTLNIDISKSKILDIQDIFEINKELISTLKMNGKNVSGIPENDTFLDEYDSSDMLVNFKDESCVYFKQNVIGFSFFTIHALGDYVNFEVSMDNLKDFLKVDVL